MLSNRRTIVELQDRMDDLEADAGGWIESVMTRRITIHTKDGQSIDGSLVAEMSDGVILRAPTLLPSEEGNKPILMAGEVWVPRENVAFAQLNE